MERSPVAVVSTDCPGGVPFCRCPTVKYGEEPPPCKCACENGMHLDLHPQQQDIPIPDLRRTEPLEPPAESSQTDKSPQESRKQTPLEPPADSSQPDKPPQESHKQISSMRMKQYLESVKAVNSAKQNAACTAAGPPAMEPEQDMKNNDQQEEMQQAASKAEAEALADSLRGISRWDKR